jgi:hypothetical protein
MAKGVGETIGRMSRRRYQNVPWGLLIGGGALVAAIAAFFLIRSHVTASADPVLAPAPAGSAALDSLLSGGSAPSRDTPPSAPREQMLGKALLPDAIAAARPQMKNTIGRLDPGSVLLSLWASRHLTWAALEALPETSRALFRKDPEAERGKRLCMAGTVREIRAEKSLAARMVDDRPLPLIVRPTMTPTTSTPPSTSDSSGVALGSPDSLSDVDAVIPDDGKVFIAVVEAKSEGGSEQRIGKGSAASDQPLVVEVVAVRSTGSLVDGSEARVCGILTGVNLALASRISPTEVTEHRLVGMFDLPQNRSATNEVATHGE